MQNKKRLCAFSIAVEGRPTDIDDSVSGSDFFGETHSRDQQFPFCSVVISVKSLYFSRWAQKAFLSTWARLPLLFKGHLTIRLSGVLYRILGASFQLAVCFNLARQVGHFFEPCWYGNAWAKHFRQIEEAASRTDENFRRKHGLSDTLKRPSRCKIVESRGQCHDTDTISFSPISKCKHAGNRLKHPSELLSCRIEIYFLYCNLPSTKGMHQLWWHGFH